MATGEVELEGKTLVLRRVAVAYRLEVDADTDRAAVDRAMSAHPQACPVYRSIHPQIECSVSLEVVGG